MFYLANERTSAAGFPLHPPLTDRPSVGSLAKWNLLSYLSVFSVLYSSLDLIAAKTATTIKTAATTTEP